MSATTIDRRSATGAKWRGAGASGSAESNTTRRAPGCASSQCRASTLMTKPVAPVMSRFMGAVTETYSQRKLPQQADERLRAHRKVLERHRLMWIVTAVIIAYENHGRRNS